MDSSQFFTMINTTECCLWVVQMCTQQIQGGRRPPFWKKGEKATYLGLPNSSYHTKIPALVFNNAIYCFNSHSSGESGLAGLLPPLVLGQNLLRNVTQVSMGQTSFLSLNQQYQSTEGNSKHWSNQWKSPTILILSSSTTGLLRKGNLLMSVLRHQWPIQYCNTSTL